MRRFLERAAALEVKDPARRREILVCLAKLFTPSFGLDEVDGQGAASTEASRNPNRLQRLLRRKKVLQKSS